MKKIPTNYRLRQKRIEIDRIKRRNRHARHRTIRPSRTPDHEIVAPQSIALLPRQVDSVVLFVRKLSSKALGNSKVVINFSNTKRISALGAVYLYSEIDRVQMKLSVKIRIRGVSVKQVRYALRMTGIFKLCGHPDPPADTTIPIFRGKGDHRLDDITQYLMDTALLANQLGIDNWDHAERLANKAIGEAMLNVKYHAYRPDENHDFWWVTATILDDELHVALCDRGVGIPKTLPEKAWFKKFAKTLKLGIDDAKMIKEAMEYTRSSRQTRQGVGLGSRDIQALISEQGRGQLTIISGAGHYRLQAQDGKAHETARKIRYDVAGTLIQWRIPLPQPIGGK